MPSHHPIFAPAPREPTHDAFSREELRLANRNAGTLLEALRHELTPVGLHYLLVHFDVPYVPSPADWTLAIGGLVEQPLRLTLDEIVRKADGSEELKPPVIRVTSKVRHARNIEVDNFRHLDGEVRGCQCAG